MRIHNIYADEKGETIERNHQHLLKRNLMPCPRRSTIMPLVESIIQPAVTLGDLGHFGKQEIATLQPGTSTADDAKTNNPETSSPSIPTNPAAASRG